MSGLLGVCDQCFTFVPSNPNHEIQFMFFFVLRCIFIYFFSFLILLFSLHQLDRASSIMPFFSSSSKNFIQWRSFFHFEKIKKWSIEKSCAIKSTYALTFNLVIIHLLTAIYLQFNCFSQREISIIERVKERCMFQQIKKKERKEREEKMKEKEITVNTVTTIN